MWRIAEEIETVDREHSLGIKRLAVADREELRARVHFLYGVQGERIWEHVQDCASTQDAEAWRWISEFVGSRECVLLFDGFEEVEMFSVPSGPLLDVLLWESVGFEFYITDRDASYLICFNHHDVLVCCGHAKRWLVERLQVRPAHRRAEDDG